MRKRLFIAIIVLSLLSGALFGCNNTEENFQPETTAKAADPVVLTISGGWQDCRALDDVASKFTEKYSNCTIIYEYLQDYNQSLPKRLTGDEQVDLFFTTNIQADSNFLQYALDLKSCGELDLSNTFDGLIENFIFRDDTDTQKLYSIPLGAEMRGLYVNKTLLKSLNTEVPTNKAELLNACKLLKENGYIPFHGNPSNFGQLLLYPWICNLIANSDDSADAYEIVNSRSAGVSEMLREPFEFLYGLTEKGYYDYKKAQTELNLFTEMTDDDYARYFLNIEKNGDEWVKADDIGQIAFMPATLSVNGVIEKTKDDYHSNIDYVFIPAPVANEGGYVYLSPAHAISANKNSPNSEWSIKFLDFLFQPENNKLFAEKFNVIPNTKEAFDYIHTMYDVSDNHITHLGQVTFGYGFYEKVSSALVNTAKSNNPKYMIENEDGTTSLYPLNYYLEAFEKSITEHEE